jgi:TonB family protein
MHLSFKLVFILLLITRAVAAQKPASLFYDSTWVLTNRMQSAYFRVALLDTIHFVFLGQVKDYNASGRLQMKGTYRAGKKEDTFYFYHKNGQLKVKGAFAGNEPVGEWRYFYEDGSPHQLVIFKDGERRILSYRDASGTLKVEEGNGLWEGAFYDAANRQTFLISGQVEEGLADGWWSYIDENGRLVYEEKFNKGKFRFGRKYTNYEQYGARVNEPLRINPFIPGKLALTESFTRSPMLTRNDYPFMPFLPGADTLYFSEDGLKSGPEEAAYFRVGDSAYLESPEGNFREYYMNGQLRLLGSKYKDENHGRFTYFYPGGDTLKVGLYDRGKQTGEWRHYHNNGQPHLLEYYEEGVRYVEKCWNREGELILNNGDGIYQQFYLQSADQLLEKGTYRNYQKHGEWTGYYRDGRVSYREKYEDGKLIDGKRYTKSGRILTYTTISEQPAPEGGMEAFYKFVARKLRYPAKARNAGIQGKVLVSITIKKDGTLAEVRSISSPARVLSEEAERVISQYPGWIAGKKRGEPVKVRLILPLTFSIN